ncbi:site-specific integrase [Mycobacterium sp.]|uniref:site-specific integrase n=1 Tax=Mycobacterium sp. TaxID=1785 RepID=UPI003F9DEEEF
MAGRPPLRIGQHGKITRKYLGGGVWLARCRFRDSDGVPRVVERRGPADEHDKRGKLAEDLLIEALMMRRPAAAADEVTLDTRIMALVDVHIARLAEDGRAVRTLDTYRYTAGKLTKFLRGVRVGEATAPRIDAAVRSMRAAHGPVMARQARTVLRGALQLAVMASVLGTNPVRDVQAIKSKAKPKGAAALTGDQLRDLLGKLRTSDYCREHDLVDPITLLCATGLRRSELLGLRWSDFDEDAGMLTVRGKVVRVAGKGLERIDDTKTDAGKRTIPLPQFAIGALQDRRGRPYLGEQAVIFPSTAGTLRDPDNFGKQWRAARDELGVSEVTTHSFRKTLATLIDDEGLSARIGADHLGHSNVSMTQDRYMARGRVHAKVAELLDRTVAINDE